jgi:putative transposase
MVGGGLVRSVGGWFVLKGLRLEGVRVKGDERIIGSSDFVEKVLEQANEEFEQSTRLRNQCGIRDLIWKRYCRE